MTTLLIQIFGAMALTFLLGLILGWVIWRYGVRQDEATDEFWRGKFEQSRGEFFTQETAFQGLLEEHEKLKERLAGITAGST